MLDLSMLAVMIGGAIFLTRIPGVFFPKETAKVFKKCFKADDVIFRLVGVSFFMLSVLFLYSYRKLVWEWEVAMTIMGVFLFVMALVMMYAPETIKRMGKRVFDWSEGVLWLCFLGAATVGLFYVYLGLYIY